MLRSIAAIVTLTLSLPSSVDAFATYEPTVTCSTVKPTKTNSTWFQVCSTTSFVGGRVISPPGSSVEWIPSGHSYYIVQGLKAGTDTTTLSDAAHDKAFRSGLDISVRLTHDTETCVVTVSTNDERTDCASCKFCGNEKYAADCTNIPNGRSTRCELSTLSNIYFPLTKAALSSGNPATVQPPVKAPVKSPFKSSPVKAPARTPIKWIVPVPVKAPVK